MKKLFTVGVILSLCFMRTHGQTLKNPFLEVFTSATCGPCNQGNANLDGILENYPEQFVLLKYQMSWPGNGDDYYTLEAGSRRGFYGVSGIPDMFVNGVHNYDPRNFTGTDLEERFNEPAKVDITIWDSIAGQTVYYDVQVTTLEPISAPAHRIFIAIAEERTEQNVASNGETEFFNVMKKMIPGGTGTIVIDTDGLPADTTFSFVGSYEFQGSYDGSVTADEPVDHNTAHTVEHFDKLFTVAWIQDISNDEVLQSQTSLYNEALSVHSDVTNFKFDVYPIPAEDFVIVETSSETTANIEILDLNGRVLSQTTPTQGRTTVNTSDLSAGVYVIRVEASMRKFVIH